MITLLYYHLLLPTWPNKIFQNQNLHLPHRQLLVKAVDPSEQEHLGGRSVEESLWEALEPTLPVWFTCGQVNPPGEMLTWGLRGPRPCHVSLRAIAALLLDAVTCLGSIRSFHLQPASFLLPVLFSGNLGCNEDSRLVAHLPRHGHSSWLVVSNLRDVENM